MIREIILNNQSEYNGELTRDEILYNNNPTDKGSKIDNLLDKNILRMRK